ncbi:MAG: serine/threonine-protein kinase [Nocardioides sp.]
MIAGRYELEREVGRGGMGAVWLARDAVLGRQVAIKKVGVVPGGANPDLERAEREARLAARLNHPHVVAVYDLVTDGGSQYLVMEYVEGVTLAGLVDRDGPLLPDQVSPLVAQAADALAAAHAAGIVHRDVKPSNILVTAEGEVKLSDFGIARAEADASLTQTGLVTGSPAYLSPEVASGHTATDASDVWSLGATVFHALSGRPPYEVGDNLMGALYRIVHEQPPRLANAGWLAPMLDATMTQDPADRWSMAQVRDFLAAGPTATALRPVPAGAPEVHEAHQTQVLAPAPVEPVTPGARDGSGPRRRSALLPLGILAAVIVVLLAVVLAITLGDDPATDPPTGGGSPTERDPTNEPAAEPNAADMEAFIGDYLATAPTDPETTYEMLTPAFQEQSGFMDGYTGFWSTIETADLVEVAADPQALTVAYTVAYVTKNGDESTDDVVLRLVFQDGQYLIAEER